MKTLINDYSLKYHRRRLKNFWQKWRQGGNPYRNVEWWIKCMDLAPMNAGKEAKGLIKDFIRIAVLEKKISIEEGNRLWDMIKSPDQENQYIGLSIIASHYPSIFAKENPKFTLL